MGVCQRLVATIQRKKEVGFIMKIIRFNFIWNKNKIEIIKCENGKFVMIK